MGRRRWVMVSVALTLVACQTESSRSSPLERANAEIFCRAVFACPIRNPAGAFYSLAYADEQDCVARYPEPIDASLAAAFAQGTVELDLEAVERCKAEIAVTCPLDGVGALPHACSQIVRGTVSEGEPCALARECATGTCTIAEGAACGTCAAGTAPLGGSCSFDGQCAPSVDGNVVCQVDETFQSTCRLEIPIVVIAGAVGAPCGLPADASGNLHVCETGLYCDPNRTCRVPIAQGELCSLGNEACVVGSVCLDVGGESRCRGAVRHTSAGERCDVDASFIHVCEPSAGLVCDADATCHAFTDGERGSPCTVPTHCDEGLFCASAAASEGVCEPLRGNGAACEGDFECLSTHCEIGANDQGVCADPSEPMLCSAG